LKRWAELERTTKETRTRHQASVGALEDRLRKLDAAWLFDQRIDERTYIEQRDRLREELALAQMDLAAATLEDIDVRGVLDYGLHVLQHSAALWTAADTQTRMRLQWAMFPTGLTWDGERVGTGVTSLAFYGWEQIDAGDNEWCALVDSNH
jgi:hypothetical protein